MAKQKNVPDAFPANASTAQALADAGVKTGDVIGTDVGELRIAGVDTRGTEIDRIKFAIRMIAAHYGPDFERDINYVLD